MDTTIASTTEHASGRRISALTCEEVKRGNSSILVDMLLTPVGDPQLTEKSVDDGRLFQTPGGLGCTKCNVGAVV